MSSPERCNPEGQDSLWTLREQTNSAFGKPCPDVTRALISRYNHSFKEAIFKPLFSDKGRLKKHLITLKTELYPNNPYFAPLVCAYQINYVKESIIIAEAKEAAAGFADQDNQVRFAILFDIAHGMQLVVDSVVGAEENLRNPSETELSNAVDNYAERFDLNPVENAEVFLTTKQLLSHFSELLQRDNSGFLLIKEVVQSLKDYKSSKKKGINIPIPEYHVPEFVSAGAETGLKLYKRLYPLID